MNKIKKYARWIYQYRKVHGIEASSEYDYFLGKRFAEDDFWQGEIRRHKVNPKQLLQTWLTTIIYQYTNGDDTKQSWWDWWRGKFR